MALNTKFNAHKRSYRQYTAEELALRAFERRPLGSCLQDTCRQTRYGGGLPEDEEGAIPAGITHDLVLQFDLPARKMEREERLLGMSRGNLGQTLCNVVEAGGVKDTRFLLSRGADVNYVDEVWCSLEFAAEQGSVELVTLLLDAGATALEHALIRAAEYGHRPVVELLLERQAEQGAEPVFSRAFYLAAHFGHAETVRVLLENGADENMFIPGYNDLADREILEFAVGMTRTEVVRVLLQHGANVHANDGGALRRARRIARMPTSHDRLKANEEVIELLLAHGAVDQAAPEVEAEEAEEAEDDGAGAAGAAAAAEGGDEGDLN